MRGEALEETLGVPAERLLVEELTDALRFILAFYEPGQTHLDTNAWRNAEAGGRAALAKGEAALVSTAGTGPVSPALHLANNVKSIWSAFEAEIREACGNTNYNVVKYALEQFYARSAEVSAPK